METQHGVYSSLVVPEGYLQPPGGGQHYCVSKSVDGKLYCPVLDCCGEAKTVWGMRRHFCLRHPHDWAVPDGEVRYNKCENCGMQTSPLAWVKNGGHSNTALCKTGG